ncbi:tRNA U34 5-methylaminomethyl-2-thiouridine-forming methyltransferase MnmC [Tenacibaculum adriaticum]|uniref:tRNA U34 5-methylaminomethyl-2-thiouridine-forming methyltransferase MnmC n=1 Tax=Tenacibaculum adriaticum TaxID=413713 RepID=A0A5S5DUS1_9FLAO|nr:tRNA (5-methylaminomethyl-2-thiouridine)(34)-methyltransferase MnmD [Tenacibaculum adriaticum]TYP99454.1 tRNA U34 5-methylaminomethyl-2-thiouridine-forming methyltransferase MnmC [Tenacibaculum adriaticum]
MKREIIITSDGSTTIYLPEWNERYHSKHGAIQEAYHVYIKSGLEEILSEDISILEIGFGTGLNCFITLLESDKRINYVGVEAYPVTKEEVEKLNYVSELKANEFNTVFDKIHAVSWGEKHQINKNFQLTKRNQFFKDITDENKFDLIYFDAFAPDIQPELWTEAIFKKMYTALKPNGILVTYAAKGEVKRTMKAVGFTIERLPGPPGKWHMLRATKK